MTRLALLLALCCAGCAATNGGGGLVPSVATRSAAGVRASLAAPADTLSFTLPTRGALGCWTSERDTLRERLRWQVRRLNTVTPPGYFHGCEALPECWRGVRAFNVPVAVDSGWAMPGDSVSVRVGAGQYYATSANSKGWTWCMGNVVMVQ